jgi:hypothetical protein
MKRVVLTLVAAAALTLGTALPIASFGLTQVTLTCDDGTDITAEVDADELEGLVLSVQALTLYPAGLACTLAQAPVVHALGGAASAGSYGTGGFLVGGGRLLYPCPNTVLPTDFWVNFGVSAHTATANAGATKSGGTLNFTIPAGQCVQGHLTSKPTCLRIDAAGTPPPAGAWYAYLTSFVTQTTGSHFAPYANGEISSGWRDNGNPGKQLADDRIAVQGGRVDCPNVRWPDPDGNGSRPILNGNITIHRAQ